MGSEVTPCLKDLGEQPKVIATITEFGRAAALANAGLAAGRPLHQGKSRNLEHFCRLYGLDSIAARQEQFRVDLPAFRVGNGGANAMDAVIRDISGAELSLFGDIVARLERLGPELDARAIVFNDVMRLLRSDFGASYVWDSRKNRFIEAVSFNMAPDNLRRYEDWYQFRDPMTFQLRARRRATLVDDVISRDRLERTEFYNDFLARDGLHHGINMFIFDRERDLGDLRIWRARDRPDFSGRDTALLDALEPHLRRALLRCTGNGGLTPREHEVAALVARGCTDRDIARVLGIGFGTVRTHLTNAMTKSGCANRAELAAAVARRRMS
jgi:DNA-binding CsgD family transcriptional regulator